MGLVAQEQVYTALSNEWDTEPEIYDRLCQQLNLPTPTILQALKNLWSHGEYYDIDPMAMRRHLYALSDINLAEDLYDLRWQLPFIFPENYRWKRVPDSAKQHAAPAGPLEKILA